MMEEAAKKIAANGWRNVEFIRGDAAEVSHLVSEPVDAVISTGCLCIVPGWERAIAGATDLLNPGGRLVVLDWSTLKPKGPMQVVSPLVEWWIKHYGFVDLAVDFTEVRPWKRTMEKYLARVSYRESFFGTTFLCHGEKVKKEATMAKDPVCDMDVDEKAAAGTSEYEGKTYHFCAPACKKTFDENPEKYTK